MGRLAPPRLRIGLLGSLQVRTGAGCRLGADDFASAKTRHLLRLLALEEGRPVRTDLLIELLWADSPEPRGRASLRTAVSELRSLVGGHHVVRAADTLRLVDAVADTTRFDHLARTCLESAGHGDWPAARRAAARALEVYRGPLAEDEPYLEPLLLARERFALLHRELLLTDARAALETEAPVDAITRAHVVFDRMPTGERACRLLMTAYARLGEPALALGAFQRCRQALDAEFGIRPSTATYATYRAVLFEDPHLVASG